MANTEKSGKKWEMWKTNKEAKETEQYLKEKQARVQDFVEAEGRLGSVSSLKDKFEKANNARTTSRSQRRKVPDTPEVYYSRKMEESTDVLKRFRFEGIGLQSYVQNLDLTTRFGKETLMRAFVKSQEESSSKPVTVDQAIKFLDEVKIRPKSPQHFERSCRFPTDFSDAEDRAPTDSEPGRRRHGSHSPMAPETTSPKIVGKKSIKIDYPQPEVHIEPVSPSNTAPTLETVGPPRRETFGLEAAEWEEWESAVAMAVAEQKNEQQTNDNFRPPQIKEQTVLQDAVNAGITKASQAKPDTPPRSNRQTFTEVGEASKPSQRSHGSESQNGVSRKHQDRRSNQSEPVSWKIIDDPIPEPEPHARQPTTSKEPAKGKFGQEKLKKIHVPERRSVSTPASKNQPEDTTFQGARSTYSSTFRPVPLDPIVTSKPKRRSSGSIGNTSAVQSPIQRPMMFSDVLGPATVDPAAEEDLEAFEIVEERQAVGEMIRKFEKRKGDACNPSSECQACSIM